MEEQDRDSPHIYIVLWIGKTLEQLLEVPNLMTVALPDRESDYDLYPLVTDKQTHTCTNYCLKPSNEGPMICRFGFPKQVVNNTFINPASRVQYQHGIQEDRINSYNPYLLQTW